MTTSKVRIPAKMVGKLIGERGKTVVEISRDSKCRVSQQIHIITEWENKQCGNPAGYDPEGGGGQGHSHHLHHGQEEGYHDGAVSHAKDPQRRKVTILL